MAEYARSGPRTGTSVLSGASPRPFSTPGSRGYGKGRIRGDQSIYEQGPPAVQGAPGGRPLAPEIGPNEPRGPADIARGDRKRSW
jgi:hypothetical protein